MWPLSRSKLFIMCASTSSIVALLTIVQLTQGNALLNRVGNADPASLSGHFLGSLHHDVSAVDGNRAPGRTIFVSISTWRDRDCQQPLLTGFARARYPERVFFAVVYQIKAGEDKDCAVPDVPCEADPTQVLCRYASQIKFVRHDYTRGRGPTYARYVADGLYTNETFALQVDGHTAFRASWDTIAIAQWDVLNNTMAVLTGYPPGIFRVDADGMERMPCEPLRILCASHRGGPNVPDQMWRHSRGTRVTKRAEKECDAETPLLEPLLGAGFVFSRGERVVEVRNECCTPFLFDGEEFSLGARLWTHGYDLYAPMRSIAYHPYGRKNIPLVWDLRFELRDYEKLRKQGTERIHAVLHDKETSYKNYDTTDLDKFTLGTKRSLHQFGEIFRVNWKLGRIDVCEVAVSGKLHKRIYDKVPDDKTDGIDYSGVRAKDLWGEDLEGGK
eukprot:GEMP01036489.1.p1 GENE.GEMP01036489.1~~GEMP01036489.1.p1  ORF type:complete len:444 (+),score=86.01 GEMP01036489.1:186-1517(+)